jgi:hypothetical protein
MAKQIRIAALFHPEPTQWGLRGDPHLWREMQQQLVDASCPDSVEELVAIVEDMFVQLTGLPISHPEFILIDRYPRLGMSGGFVSPEFWRDEAIPLLRRRYVEA